MSKQVTGTAKFIEFEGKTIFHAEYAGLNPADLAKAIKENEDAIVRMGELGERNLLVLTDLTSTVINLEVIEAFKTIAKAMKPYTKGSAVVGVTGFRRFALDLVNTFSTLETKAFDTVETGKEWLVSL